MNVKKDITTEAQKILSCIYRTGQRFGHSYVIDVLRGSKIEKITDNGHHELSVYGIGKEHSKAYWELITERLMEISALKRGEFRALVIDTAGMKILKKELSVDIKAERLDIKKKKNYIVHHDMDDDLDRSAFESLRSLRAEIAKEEGKPAYIVFGDKSLKEMAKSLPQNKDEMMQINGVGEMKYKRYGELFLNRCITLKTQS